MVLGSHGTFGRCKVANSSMGTCESMFVPIKNLLRILIRGGGGNQLVMYPHSSVSSLSSIALLLAWPHTQAVLLEERRNEPE